MKFTIYDDDNAETAISRMDEALKRNGLEVKYVGDVEGGMELQLIPIVGKTTSQRLNRLGIK
jgi:hypothetical protein